MAPTDGDSEDEKQPVGTDEHGDPFRDFGFLKRVEEHRTAGNSDFKKERYADALKEYASALQLLVTIAEDKSIVIGVKKWESVIVLRSTIYLNRSACYYKLKAWREAADDASACLAGNIPAETKFTHDHILADAKPSQIPETDKRLSRATRTKAWFRMSECYLNLGFLSRAGFAAKKAAVVCEDQKTAALIEYHRKKIIARGKQAKRAQQKQFKDYWDKLGEQEGGYVKADFSKRAQTKSKWASLDAEEKLKHVDQLDGSDGDSDGEFEGLVGETGIPALTGTTALAALPALEEGAEETGTQQWSMQERYKRDPADIRLEEIWRRRQQEETGRAKAWEDQRSRRTSGGVKPAAVKGAAIDSDDD